MDWMKEAANKAAESKPVPGSVLPPRTPGRILHVDGDYLAYFAAGGEDCEPGRARLNVLDRVETAMAMGGCGRCLMHLTAGGSHKGHRYIIATVKDYQGQRGGSAKPKNWEYLRGFLESYQGPAFKTKLWAEREADDGIALYAQGSMAQGRPGVIHTRDKDMRMLPGLHLNWMTYQLIDVPLGSWDVVGADGLQYGHKWFFLQLLQGDSADNIPGLPMKRMGPKTAERALAGLTREQATQVVQDLYKAHYGAEDWADRLAEQAALLWLRLDRPARVNDWLQMFPGDEEMRRAADRLVQRLNKQLSYLEELGCSV